MKICSRSMYHSKCFWILVTILVYCLKIIGLAPFCVKTKTKSFKTFVHDRFTFYNHRFVFFLFSKTGLAYNILLIVLIPVLVVLQLPQLLSVKSELESSITRVINIEQSLHCIFTAWVVIVSWTLHQTRAAQVMNQLLEVVVKLDSPIKKQPSDQNFAKKALTFSIKHVIVHSSLWITISVAESIQAVISDAFINWFFFTVPSFVIFWFIVQYYIAVGLVAENLKGVNRNLSNFDNEFCQGEISSLSLVILDESRPYATGWQNSVKNRSSMSQLDAVHSLQNIRTTINELSQEIEKFFTFPILLCVTYSFFSLVDNTHYLVTRVVLQYDDSSINLASATIAWIFVNVYPLTLLSSNVSKTVAEAELTGRIVHKLLAAETREEIKKQLHQFSLQLLHEKISFTASGFFELDFTLLNSMIGATATYLVILVQFQKENSQSTLKQ